MPREGRLSPAAKALYFIVAVVGLLTFGIAIYAVVERGTSVPAAAKP